MRQVNDRGIVVRSPTEEGGFPFFQITQTCFGTYSKGRKASFWRGKAAGARSSKYSTPSGFEVRNEWSYNSTPEFYIHSSVHRNSILIRPNKMQQYAGIYLLQNHSTCFGCPTHPSSGVRKTVTVASGTGTDIWATTFRQRDPIRLCWRKVVAQILWPVQEAAVTVLCTPDDGCDGHPKHVE